MKTLTEINKGCGKIFIREYKRQCGQIEDLKHSDSILLCPQCQALLEQKENDLLKINTLINLYKVHKKMPSFCRDLMRELKGENGE